MSIIEHSVYRDLLRRGSISPFIIVRSKRELFVLVSRTVALAASLFYLLLTYLLSFSSFSLRFRRKKCLFTSCRADPSRMDDG